MGRIRAALGAALLVAAVGAQAAPVSGQGTWETTLKGRDASGNAVPLLVSGAPNPALKYVYDVTLDLTWLADWNVNGAMNWAAAKAWAAGLTDFGGGWSLPGVLDIGNDGCNFSKAGGTDCGYNVYMDEVQRRNSPLAHMFYDTLGNLAYCPPGNVLCLGSGVPQAGWGLKNTGPFRNMGPGNYWYGTVHAPSLDAWAFNTYDGYQYPDIDGRLNGAVAVRRGDVLRDGGNVPEPQSLVLALTALAGLGAAQRLRRAA